MICMIYAPMQVRKPGLGKGPSFGSTVMGTRRSPQGGTLVFKLISLTITCPVSTTLHFQPHAVQI